MSFIFTALAPNCIRVGQIHGATTIGHQRFSRAFEERDGDRNREAQNREDAGQPSVTQEPSQGDRGRGEQTPDYETSSPC